MEFSLFFASSTFHLGKDKLVNKKRLEVVNSSMMSTEFLFYFKYFFFKKILLKSFFFEKSWSLVSEA